MTHRPWPATRMSTSRAARGMKATGLKAGGLRSLLLTIGEALAPAAAYLVGGAVRDLRRGLAPNDLDLVVAGDASDQTAAIGRGLDGHVFALDEARGQYRIALTDGRPVRYIDVAPLVGDIEADLRERDFTIDAMAAPLIPGAGLGPLIDPLGGARDLEARIVRMTDAARFAADPLRLLRAVRLASELDFEIEAATAAAIEREAGQLEGIAAERQRDELCRMLATPRAAMEETSSWQHPVELPRLLDEAGEAFDEALAVGGERNEAWDEHRPVAESILDEPPDRSLRRIVDAARAGAPLGELSATVAYAAARRPLHFHISNEFGDWNTVHHTFTYTNAVDRAMQRAPSRELARAILDGAASVYLERFLNMPRQPRPEPNGGSTSTDGLMAHFDRQQQVDETAQTVADLLAGGQQTEVARALGSALLREDAGFHSFQIYDAALRLAERFEGRPEADDVLIGASRFLTAHAPTVRSMGQTYETAARLHRGEALHA